MTSKKSNSGDMALVPLDEATEPTTALMAVYAKLSGEVVTEVEQERLAIASDTLIHLRNIHNALALRGAPSSKINERRVFGRAFFVSPASAVGPPAVGIRRDVSEQVSAQNRLQRGQKRYFRNTFLGRVEQPTALHGL